MLKTWEEFIKVAAEIGAIESDVVRDEFTAWIPIEKVRKLYKEVVGEIKAGQQVPHCIRAVGGVVLIPSEEIGGNKVLSAQIRFSKGAYKTAILRST